MNDEAKDQAKAQMASVSRMAAALTLDWDRLEDLRDERDSAECPNTWAKENPDVAEELGELESKTNGCKDVEEAGTLIDEDPLSIEVRSGWNPPGEGGMEAEEFRVVLCTGGPHVELRGDLSNGEPSRVRCLYSDWGTSGELFDFDHDAALAYLSRFFGG